ncbi:hypothetical protein XH86_08725 [Bradyrhizobium guangdongense]|uniref:Uncharacterized protein n=1 Tax=Bradyrhizobium guangdongense TaxID=1325090 RepID=A0ABX6UBZ3_9BRAD|nr:hypothetical protein X265_08725 [Bradyrhizobium guangdongense]QOZ58808.1 hypothetical protein XH86_08725 [Bradyrhizobium guangdongense]
MAASREMQALREQNASTASLRAQRTNPDHHRGEILDCFAALAMTEQGATISIFCRPSNLERDLPRYFAARLRPLPPLPPRPGCNMMGFSR